MSESISVTKTGTGDITNLGAALSGANEDSFTLGTLDATTLNSTTTSAAVTIKPKDGLLVGTYTATLTVTADNSVSQSFNVSFTGTKHDTITYTADKAKETIEALLSGGKNVAKIVATNTDNAVTETKINIPRDTLSALSSGNINLEIETNGVRLSLPKTSIQDVSKNGQLAGDLYFRVVPIKDEVKQQEIKTTANKEMVIKAVSGKDGVQVLGTPMTIETNMSGGNVDIVMPLTGVTLPSDPAEREAFLKDLGVFIEHSDGEKVLQKGEIVEYKPGVYGIKFTVNKFSDFTIVKLNQVQTNQTTGYVTPNYVAGTVGSTSSSSSSTNSSSNDKAAKENVQTTTTNNNSTAPAEGWNQNSKDWKYIKNGQPVTGWNQINGAWYLMDSTGTMQVGWKQENGVWYLLKNDGAMATGWQQVDGQWYFLKDNGAMAEGWVQSNGIWYLLKDNGAMAVGWQQSNGEWYYLYSDGAMASNTIIDGYPLNENGAWSNQ